MTNRDINAHLSQDLFSFGLVMAQLMGLLVDPAVQYPAIPPPCGAEVLCFDEAQMGVLVEHYKRRVRAEPTQCSSFSW